jgi:hypothetical protein
MSSIGGSTPGFYRIVSPALTTGVKTGSLNDNIAFNTNIPSLDFAIRIRRVIWMMSFSAFALSTQDPVDTQYFVQLTENQTKTAILTTDTSFLAEAWMHFVAVNHVAAGAGSYAPSNLPMRIVDQFSDPGTPYTVATKLNFVVTQVNNGAAPDTGTILKPFVMIEYTLERLTADLRVYLSTRLQIQGS